MGNSPGVLLLDEDEMIWVICGGGDDIDYTPLNDGKLVKLDPAKSADETSESVVLDVELATNLTAKAATNGAKDKIFYWIGNSVYSFDVSSDTAPSSAILTEANATSFYGIGVDPEDDLLYLADSKNFAGNGTVYRYTASGQLVDSKPAGRGPNGFVFK